MAFDCYNALGIAHFNAMKYLDGIDLVISTNTALIVPAQLTVGTLCIVLQMRVTTNNASSSSSSYCG